MSVRVEYNDDLLMRMIRDDGRMKTMMGNFEG